MLHVNGKLLQDVNDYQVTREVWEVYCNEGVDIILSIHICSLHEQPVSVTTLMAFHLAATVCYHSKEVTCSRFY
jgi:hypothetical protein